MGKDKLGAPTRWPRLTCYVWFGFPVQGLTVLLCHLAGDIVYGRYHKSFDKLAQIIFIRHGEKVHPLSHSPGAVVCSGVPAAGWLIATYGVPAADQ